MGYPKGAGARRNGKNFATLAQYFAIGKAHRGGNCYGREWEPGVQGAETGSSDPPVPPPHYLVMALVETVATYFLTIQVSTVWTCLHEPSFAANLAYS